MTAVALLIGLTFSAHAETFLSVSDIHFDPFADPSLVPKLEAANVAQWPAILASSSTTTFSTYGSDVNDPLLRSAVAEMKTQLPKPAFVLISGDFLAHKFQQKYQQYATDKSQTAYTAFVTKTVAYVASVLRDAFPHVRIYPTLGNNDSDCGDYAVAPNSIFLANFRDIWSPAVDSRSFVRRFPTGGYYHADVPGVRNLRIIAINTNFFSTDYKNPCGKPGPDAGLQELRWLDDELRLARDEHKRVWLLFHIPPGMDVYDTMEYGGSCPGVKAQTFWKDQYQEPYLRITANHRATIRGSFAGHTHQDEFRIANGAFIHITPSISPVFGNNPAFEIVHINENAEVLDYTAHHLPNVTAPWAREYAFDEAYGQRRYDTASLAAIDSAMHDNTTMRTQFFTFMAAGAPKSAADALASWQGYACGFRMLTASSFMTCYCPASTSAPPH
ncbi:MAG: metallophosphoesterase [Acidobacteria bacterium]|nr:metallophosphoesterase [Acidobacteriota bacterium]MBV9478150.1 metallophosphoesterase [Acidobacteriota bacterium]